MERLLVHCSRSNWNRSDPKSVSFLLLILSNQYKIIMHLIIYITKFLIVTCSLCTYSVHVFEMRLACDHVGIKLQVFNNLNFL